ncbi:MAG: CBS domain-containing protein, partial [Acidimicrobiales bacterium]
MPAAPTTRTVAEVMSTPPVTAVASESISEVSARMRDRQKGSVIVIEGERPIGILTERDLVRFNATGTSATEAKIGEWMTQPVDTAAPDLSVQEAFATFAERGYRHLPVVDGDSLVGVVSLRSLMEFAQVQPVVHPSTIEAPPGLEGVIVAETSVGDVRGLEGFYHYRQYNAVELADKLPLEDVWHLLFEGNLPTPAERASFAAEVNPLRVVPPSVAELLPALAASSQTVMEAVRSAMSMVGAAEGFQPTLDIDHAERRRNALQMCAVMPTLIMAIHRLQQGQEPIAP